MTTIGPVDGQPPLRPTASARGRVVGGFQVAPDGSTSSAATESAAGPGQATPVSLDVLLAAEALDQDARRNAAARRQGHAVLRGLGTLQHTLLSGSDPRAALAELAQLLSDLPPAPDPHLADALDSIALRARVELARHGT